MKIAVFRLFSIVDTKQKNPLFLFSFFVKPFSIVTQNKKWGQNFYVLGFWNIKRGHNLKHKTQNCSWGGGGKDGVQQWKGWMGRWSISMKYFPRLIPLSILKYFVLSKRRIPKIWSRCADLINCATLRQHIFRHIFSKSDPINVFFFFHVFLLKIYIDWIYFTKYFYLSRSWIQSNSPYPGSVCIVVPSQHPGKRLGPQHRVISPIVLLNFWTSD